MYDEDDDELYTKIDDIQEIEEDAMGDAAISEIGISFRFAEDKDKNTVIGDQVYPFEGEEGSEPEIIEIAGRDIAYITYNI